MVVAVLILMIVSTIFVLVAWTKRRYSIWKDKGVLFEEPHFPYGSFKGVKANAHEGQTMEKFYKKFKGQTPFVGIYLALEPIALILDIELVKRILISDFSAFQDRGIFSNPKHEPITGHIGIMSTNKWKAARSMLSRGFTVGKIKLMLSVCLQVAAKLDSKFEQMSLTGEDFDAKRLAACYTVDITGSCVLGLDCNCLEGEENELLNTMIGVFDNPLDGAVSVLVKLALRRYAEPLRVKTFRKEVSEIFTRVVKETVEFRQANNIHRQDLLETLIAAYESDGKDQITFNEVVAQTFGFFMAGYETSASTFHFLLYELAKNQDIQKEARKHIFEVLDKHQQELTFEALSDMKFIDQLILETLRMYPALASLTRESVKDYKVPNTNVTFEKGTLVMIPVYAIHHDPQFYPNPYQFDPERFSEANVKARTPASFLGFGDGPRNCLGSKLGIMQVKIGIVTALKKYEFSLAKRSMKPLELETRSFLTATKEKIFLNVLKIRT